MLIDQGVPMVLSAIVVTTLVRGLLALSARAGAAQPA
jgi:hypothetical protein